VERNLERLEITMTILEQKIASIPGMDDIVVAPLENTRSDCLLCCSLVSPNELSFYYSDF